MINVVVKNGEIKSAHLSGTAPELTADCAILLRYAYEVIKAKDEEMSDCFKTFFVENAKDVFKSQEEINAETKEMLKQKIDNDELGSLLMLMKLMFAEDGDDDEDVNLKN